MVKAVEADTNCHLATKIHQTYARNISAVGSSICRRCPYQEQCKSTEGMFLHDRALATSAPVSIMHPGSLKSDMMRSEQTPDGMRIRTTGLAFDDVTADALIDSVTISVSRIPALAEEIRRQHISRALPEFLNAFYREFSSVRRSSVCIGNRDAAAALGQSAFKPKR